MRNSSGTSLAEVMIMMVILGISLVGIYTMINNGQKLASLSDKRLVAVNIAREGLESVTTLRDTFALAGFSSGTCSDPSNANKAFFTTDGEQIGGTNCPIPDLYGTKYILNDDKTLALAPTDHDVCINENGWYSQENSATGKTCASENNGCIGDMAQSCKTQFKRTIAFKNCTPSDSEYCIVVKATVTWGSATPDETLELSQIITVK